KQHKALGSGIIDQEFDRKLLTCLGINQPGVLDFVARFPKQLQRLAQVIANGIGTAPDRIGVGLGKQIIRHFASDGLKYLQFLSGWHAGGGELGALEVAGDPFILAEKKLAVHFLEIEGEVEGPAHTRILELVATDIEGERLHDADVASRK